MKPRLLYISTLPCEPTAGGPMQMYRHFVERDDFEFQSIIEHCDRNLIYLESGIPLIDLCLYRGGKTRFFSDLLALNYLVAEQRKSKEVLKLAKSFHPQAIVTVAYGSYSFVAASVACQMKLPLITFFHDWWPDLTPCQNYSKKWLDRRFRRLYQESSLALCVGESLQQELGEHANSKVLYPIPNLNGACEETASPPSLADNRFQLVYLGTLEGDHGEMAQLLVKTLREQPQNWLDLKLYGSAADWPSEILKYAQVSGLYGGRPKHGPEAQSILSQADALLVVMNFDEIWGRRVRTSFPSKLLEYASYGKPIVVWGPEDCSAVKFLNRHDAGVVVTNPDPSALIQCLSRLANDIVWQTNLAKAAHKLSKTLFDPQNIHQQFIESVMQILNQ